MAQNLPFSIANILRSDFPHPSRIRQAPKGPYLEPLTEGRNVPYVALRCQLDRRVTHCHEMGFFGRNWYGAQTLPINSEKDARIGYVREQQRKKGMTNLIFKYVLGCTALVHFSLLSCKVIH